MAELRTVEVAVKLAPVLPWAWEHGCGFITKGAYSKDPRCNGCHRVPQTDDVVTRYLLIECED